MPSPVATNSVEQMMSSDWRADSIELDRIREELNRLWMEWDHTHLGTTTGSRFDDSSLVYMRPSTMNVIAIAEGNQEAIRTGVLLASLPDYTPSRSIVMARSAEAEGGKQYRVNVQIGERGYLEGSAPVRVEVITVAAPSGNDELLASVATPLLVADLPSVLFVPGEPIEGNELASDLVEITDGLLVDTVNSLTVGATLEHLSQITELTARLGLGDLVWTRLRTWRELIAQFFDQPSAADCLESLDLVEIAYAPKNDAGRNGVTAGLLLAGWLATRLGWKAPGELIPDGDGYRLTLRSGERGKSREIVLRLFEGQGEVPCSSLKSVSLSSSSDLAGEFVVERLDNEAISTFSKSTRIAETTRVVQASCPEDRVILAAKLRRTRVDPVYRSALAFASSLWPEGFEES